MQLLLVEDDNLLGQGIQLGLRDKGYQVDWVTDGEAALAAHADLSPDLIILDINLPKLDGLSVLRRLRQAQHPIPVLLLTARDSVEDRIAGLDSGADDYLVKPFSLAELEARIRALYRRSIGRQDESIEFRNIRLDLRAREAFIDQLPVSLSKREFDLLTLLLERPGEVLTRRRLEEQLYGEDDPESNALEVHIHNLRKKCGHDLIRTIRGVGYRVEKPA
ncbi:response regulator transcription factor [Neptuniibacter sp. CAU 1671]|uniref:response regulator n=1 Tax=Neptuniibacter sp. CAU 1671 TaxID=3032593 RepID=UPI0023DCA694|nr:response regulator transcription factor [Neptuniibacter sp. CAU 1671]MDF2181059.1 response regulator transcription factor [Neptuniibacter sp. CAU 1671]